MIGLERRFIVVDVQDTTIRSISRPNPQAGMVAKSFECDELIMAVAIEWHFKKAGEGCGSIINRSCGNHWLTLSQLEH